ncbi:MAG: energy-coupling factor transporter ATP-binding protein EcfA2 [Planctomycetaceae bacterium]|jgi:energy-coupling factor transporter ATP-binding protein EcfA2
MLRNESILKRLRAALTSQFNVSIVESLQPADSSASNRQGRGKRLIATFAESLAAPLQMTVAGEVEVHTHGVLLDEVLGTCGLIVVCGRPREAVPSGTTRPAGQVEQAIHDALLLRQTLIQQSRRFGGPRRTPYNVELVFVVDESSQSDGDGNNPLEEIAESLREIMAETGFLHAIGVSVLPMGKSDESSMSESDLRRAFPWLLADVREWFKYQDQVEPTTLTPPLQLESLTLRDFRVAGQRKLILNEAVDHSGTQTSQRAETLHLIHGQNGSGKSSLTEAIELALTDKIDRLEDAPGKQPDYVGVLTNRERRATNREVAAEVTLEVREALPDSKPEGSNSGNRIENVSASLSKLTCRVTGMAADSICERLGDAKLWQRLCGTERSRFESAASFRLDQVFSDRLIRSTPVRRAELFMEAFFPGRADQIELARVALAEFDNAWNELPKQARDQFRAGRHNPSPQRAAATVDEVLADPGAITTIVSMAGFDGDLASIVPKSTRFLDEHWPADLRNLVSGKTKSRIDKIPTSLKRLDAAFDVTRNAVAEILVDLNAALPLLETLNQWEARKGSADGTIDQFAVRLNDWLTHHADHDLAEKSRQLVQTRLLLGEQEEAKTSEVAQQVSGTDGEADNLVTRLDALTESTQRLNDLREESHRNVVDFRLAGDASTSDDIERPHLDRAALAALDQLVRVDESKPLSSTVRNCVETQSSHEFVLTLSGGVKSTVQIGRLGGLSETVRSAIRQQADLQELLQRLDARETSFVEMADALERLKNAAEACAAVDTEVIRKLENSLSGPLAKALNEFVALLTPARWAYRDVVPETGFGRKTNQLDWVVSNDATAQSTDDSNKAEGGTPMWLLLNTAELNTFVMSLFLLCGPKLDNPLRLLILDDPFQNMDELTVTTVARGIGRLQRLWSHLGGGLEFWNLLILVHGEGTMNRIREEVSCSASYLPWLQPKELDGRTTTDSGKVRDGSADHSDIETEESLLAFELDHPAAKIVIAPAS